VFGPKGDEVTGGCRKLHNEELHDLYCSPSVIRMIKLRWAEHVAQKGEKRNVYMVLVGKPERKKPLERPGRRWVDNIKVDLGETGCGGMDWIDLAQVRDQWRTLVKVIMNRWVPYNAGKFLSSCRTDGRASSAQLHGYRHNHLLE
jgi:hypothetical protein